MAPLRPGFAYGFAYDRVFERVLFRFMLDHRVPVGG
jgi:hypothetical protein